MQAGACADGQAASELQMEPAKPAVVTEAPAESGWKQSSASYYVATPRKGRSTGMTLHDVSRDLEWRQAAFEEMRRSD